MTRNIFSCLVAAFLFVFALAPVAGATVINQVFNETGATYDHIEAFVFGADFVGTGMDSFSPGSWTAGLNNLNWAVATDGTLSSVTFTTHFNTTAPSGYLDLYAFGGQSLVDTARFSFTSNGFGSLVYTETPPTGNHFEQYKLDVAQSQQGQVPEPMTAVVVGAGLIALGLLRRRKIATVVIAKEGS